MRGIRYIRGRIEKETNTGSAFGNKDRYVGQRIERDRVCTREERAHGNTRKKTLGRGAFLA